MRVKVYLGHGAAGTAASMRPYVEGLRRHGVEAVAVELPKRGRRSPVKAEQAVASFLAAVRHDGPVVVGGHSYGGRVASLAAAQAPFAGLVLFSYPLHRPGSADWESRTSHWPRISCPVLLLSGESDPFARVHLLRHAVGLLPEAVLVTYPGVGHGLGTALNDALNRAAAFVSRLGSQ